MRGYLLGEIDSRGPMMSNDRRSEWPHYFLDLFLAVPINFLSFGLALSSRRYAHCSQPHARGRRSDLERAAEPQQAFVINVRLD